MKKIIKFTFLSFIFYFTFAGCKTVSFDYIGAEGEGFNEYSVLSKKSEDEMNNYEYELYVRGEELKTVDIEKTVVYVEKPVYYPESKRDEVEKKLYGKEAVQESTRTALKSPEKFIYGSMYYDYDPDFTYEIYCQPYRITDLQLEPGEQVIEMPFLSEEKVWEIGGGVSRENNLDTQHFFFKPSHSGLITSLIIITDKRNYHILLKSFKDTYMTQVKFRYPNTMPFHIAGNDGNESFRNTGNGKFEKSGNGVEIDPRYLSFDYKMSYSKFKKPYWLPYRIYDDGHKTYITMNETVLHMTTPVLFDGNRDRINYFVDRNLIVINELIEKVTLRIGSEKVVITKKDYKPSQMELMTEKELIKKMKEDYQNDQKRKKDYEKKSKKMMKEAEKIQKKEKLSKKSGKEIPEKDETASEKKSETAVISDKEDQEKYRGLHMPIKKVNYSEDQ